MNLASYGGYKVKPGYQDALKKPVFSLSLSVYFTGYPATKYNASANYKYYNFPLHSSL